MNLEIKMYKKLTPPKAIKQIAFLNNDLFLLSSSTFLKKPWKSNNAQKDMKNDKKIGNDLNKSFGHFYNSFFLGKKYYTIFYRFFQVRFG